MSLTKEPSPSNRKRVPRAVAEHLSFIGPSHGDIEAQLNEYLVSHNSHYELASVQLTNNGSRLVTESTFEYWSTYLIAWRLRT